MSNQNFQFGGRSYTTVHYVFAEPPYGVFYYYRSDGVRLRLLGFFNVKSVKLSEV